MVNVRQRPPIVVYEQLPLLYGTFKHLSTYAVLRIDVRSRNVYYSSMFCSLTKQVGK
jgi:hypothetical protein